MTVLSRRKILGAGSFVGAATMVVGADSLVGPSVATASAAGIGVAATGGVRPEDFGAVSDGIADCTQALKAAIAVVAAGKNALGHLHRPPLILSAGVYRVTETITIPGTDVIVTGVGRQNSVLLIDHLTGPALVFTGGGDIEVRGVTISSSDSRTKGGNGDGLIFQPYPGMKLSFRISVIDVYVLGQPGNGFMFTSPEGLRLENVGAARNRGHGCLIDAGKFQDLCASIEFARFNDNGDHGLKVVNMMNSRFSRVECLNNHGLAQFALDGTNHRVEMADCECFEFAGPNQSIGLLLSGRAHIIEGGAFFKLNTAIMLKGCSDSRIRLPRIEGDRSFYTSVGVQLGPDCARNVIDLAGGNLVQALVSDQGSNNVILRNGRDPAIAPPQHAALSMPLSGQVAPNLLAGKVLSLVTEGAVHFLPPAGGAPGDMFTLIVDTGHRGIGTVNFADVYRGVPGVVAANHASRYLTACFVVAGDGQCLPHSLLAYD